MTRYMALTTSTSGLMTMLIPRSLAQISSKLRYSSFLILASLVVFGESILANVQATRLVSSLSVTARRISESIIPAFFRTSGLLPDPSMTWTSKCSEIISRDLGSRSIITTSLFSWTSLEAMLSPTCPAPIIIVLISDPGDNLFFRNAFSAPLVIIPVGYGRSSVKKHHPDNGGKQDINTAEYPELGQGQAGDNS